MNKYNAILINSEGCVFDSTTGNNIKHLRSWAIGRGGEYTLEVSLRDGLHCNSYCCKNNRSYKS